MIYSNKDTDKKKIERYFGIVNSAIKHLKSIDEKKDIQSIVISDSIILSMPIDGDDLKKAIKDFQNLCLSIALIQYALALKNIWLRGAITVGETYFNSKENQVVGKGYVNAYLLEEKMAIYPRVIIDNKLINEFRFTDAGLFIHAMNRHNYSNWSSSILYNWEKNHLYPIEKDLPLFIDYLDFCVNHEQGIKEGHIKKIIQNIENSIYANSEIYKKYQWISKYLCSKIEHDGNYYTYSRKLKNL